MENDLDDDEHLCIKCKKTIIGLKNYISHRKIQCCQNSKCDTQKNKTSSTNTTITTSTDLHISSPTYDKLVFSEESGQKSLHEETGGKTRQTLNENYYLSELEADVFFSSLQLQSVDSLVPTSGANKNIHTYQRLKSHDQTENVELPWLQTIQTRKKSYTTIYNDMQDSDEDDDVYDESQHSPPAVPASYTGGKWKPENRPAEDLHILRHYDQTYSSHWDYDTGEEEELHEEPISNEHPPIEHTKGKWVPGTKVQQLVFNEDIIKIKRKSNKDTAFWCNICCRKLKSKVNYENHLKSKNHIKKTQLEQQLEKADLAELHIHQELLNQLMPIKEDQTVQRIKKRKRRANLLKCELCKHVTLRHMFGKHLISHYHYRRMQTQPENTAKSLRMVLDNIHWIVLQSPFQCNPCRFYANFESIFLEHWLTEQHITNCNNEGKFWCSYCLYECEHNEQMYTHLLSDDHKEVILAINRSVPICISKKINIVCHICSRNFRYNIELREHMQKCHENIIESKSTASDAYQNRNKCELCNQSFRSKVSLQRHMKYKHCINQYHCYVCKLDFKTAVHAKMHRKSMVHRRMAHSNKQEIIKNDKSKQNVNEHHIMTLNQTQLPTNILKEDVIILKCKDCDKIFSGIPELKTHRDTVHPFLAHVCPSCGLSFAVPQMLGRHTRTCKPTNEPRDDTLNDKLFKCEECDFSASYKSELIYHKMFHENRTINKGKSLKCPLCTKYFRKDSLRFHLRKHTNEKVFDCKFCKVKFARHQNLKCHIQKLHTTTETTKQVAEERNTISKK